MKILNLCRLTNWRFGVLDLFGVSSLGFRIDTLANGHNAFLGGVGFRPFLGKRAWGYYASNGKSNGTEHGNDMHTI